MTSIDWALLLLWALVAIRNPAALLPLFILLLDCFNYSAFDTDFPRYCLAALCYIHAAQININISSQLRYAFFAFACIYWVGAIDELLYNQIDSYQGVYYDVMPYLVIALNAYIAVLLFRDGGRTFVGIIDALRRLVNHRPARL